LLALIFLGDPSGSSTTYLREVKSKQCTVATKPFQGLATALRNP
jgi:hypothetical protein